MPNCNYKELVEVRKALGYSDQKLFAQSVNTPWRTYQTYEQGSVKSVPSTFLENLHKQYLVSADWLLTGKGKMFIESKNDTRQVAIPYFPSTYAAAGGGAINYSHAETPLSFDPLFLRGHLGISNFHNLHIINAIGDSMEPTIRSGELLFVNPAENENGIVTGAIYVINYAGDVLVKRIEKNITTMALTLRSDNAMYSEFTIAQDELEKCKIIGRVVGHFDKL